MFIPNSLLKSYVENPVRDIGDIRRAILGYIDIDMWFTTNDFELAINYVLNNSISENELFEKFKQFDGKYELTDNKSEWTEDYYFYQLAYLRENFCKKRISHVKRIGKYLCPEEFKNQKNGNAQFDQQEQIDQNWANPGDSRHQTNLGQNSQGSQNNRNQSQNSSNNSQRSRNSSRNEIPGSSQKGYQGNQRNPGMVSIIIALLIIVLIILIILLLI